MLSYQFLGNLTSLAFRFGSFADSLALFLHFFADARNTDCILGSDATLKLVNATSGIDELLFAGIKRMALTTKLDVHLGLSGADGHGVAAGTDDL